MSVRSLKKKDFQLLGVTSLFIASKFEDIYPPELEELCYLCDSAYTKEDILRMESLILCEFNFEFLFVSVLDVLEQFYFTLGIKNEGIQEMSLLLAKTFLFQSHISKYNVYKIAAFILEESMRLFNLRNKSVYQIVSPQESDLLTKKLGKIVRKTQGENFCSLKNQGKELYAKIARRYS